MTSEAIAAQFWERLQARDWEQFACLLHDDFIAEFPQSGERFTKRQFLAINFSYPGDWNVDHPSIYPGKGWAITEVRVSINNSVDLAISFFTLSDGKILGLREFWPEPFDIPGWRVNLISSLR